mgnify:CR=1 FL=1
MWKRGVACQWYLGLRDGMCKGRGSLGILALMLRVWAVVRLSCLTLGPTGASDKRSMIVFRLAKASRSRCFACTTARAPNVHAGAWPALAHSSSVIALWEWAAAAAAVIVAVLFCLRLTRQGLGTLEEERDRCLERIREMEEQVREDQKNMPSGEHLRIVHAALEDLLRQAGAPTEDGLLVEMDAAGQCLVWRLPGPDGRPEEWRVRLFMRERELRGTHKVAHGQARWRLSGPGVEEDFTDLVQLLRACNGRLAQRTRPAHLPPQPGAELPDPVRPEPPHLARRLARPGAKHGPQVSVSRIHPGLVKRLFELEVPEIQSGIVQIKSISREAGSRTKMAVHSTDPMIDPVGSCVGPRGQRVDRVVTELRGEKIDIIKWSADPAEFVANALNPAHVVNVFVNEQEKACRVVVPDNQLSLAIGKEGQNARLAARLTSWKIDIKSQSQVDEQVEAEAGEAPTVEGDAE